MLDFVENVFITSIMFNVALDDLRVLEHATIKVDSIHFSLLKEI